jgi:membrane protein implicated in regulation of membrane protease activity
MANAFACRSTTRWPGSLGWTSNRLLVGAVAAELLALVGFLFIPPVASLLGHAPPPLWGWAVAALAIPALLAADAVHKLVGTREEDGSPRSAAGRTGTR